MTDNVSGVLTLCDHCSPEAVKVIDNNALDDILAFRSEIEAIPELEYVLGDAWRKLRNEYTDSLGYLVHGDVNMQKDHLEKITSLHERFEFLQAETSRLAGDPVALVKVVLDKNKAEELAEKRRAEAREKDGDGKAKYVRRSSVAANKVQLSPQGAAIIIDEAVQATPLEQTIPDMDFSEKLQELLGKDFDFAQITPPHPLRDPDDPGPTPPGGVDIDDIF